MRTAESIWRDMGISVPDEADIEVIAYFCGARVEYRPLTNCAARIIGKNNQAIITVDEASSTERQRFSVAHELGHWMGDRGDIAVSCRAAAMSSTRLQGVANDREAAANRFAVELLMPAHLFRQAALNKPVTMVTARSLADQFRVSLTAAALRLVELGSFPSIVVNSSPNGYQWSWRHPYLPRQIRVNRQLSKNTEAYRLAVSANPKPRGPTQVDAEDWVAHDGAEYYVVTEDSVRTGPQSVLSLIWWHDETAIAQL